MISRWVLILYAGFCRNKGVPNCLEFLRGQPEPNAHFWVEKVMFWRRKILLSAATRMRRKLLWKLGMLWKKKHLKKWCKDEPCKLLKGLSAEVVEKCFRLKKMKEKSFWWTMSLNNWYLRWERIRFHTNPYIKMIIPKFNKRPSGPNSNT